MGVVCSMHGREEKFVQRFSYTPELKRPVDRPRRRWKDMVVRKEMGYCVDWIPVTRDDGRLLSIRWENSATFYGTRKCVTVLQQPVTLSNPVPRLSNP
jgi:hypothetical protein